MFKGQGHSGPQGDEDTHVDAVVSKSIFKLLLSWPGLTPEKFDITVCTLCFRV